MATRIRRGDLVWRTHDPDIDKAARVYTEAATPLHKQAVKLCAWWRTKANGCARCGPWAR